MTNEKDNPTGTVTQQALKETEDLLGAENVLQNEPMSAHCSFRTGGPADLFVKVKDAEQLAALLQLLQEREIPYYLIGRGTNLLVGDRGFRGCVITLDGIFTRTECSGNRILAGAGVSQAAAAACARDHSLTGYEFAAGIPGSVGGGLVMNAGAYGGEMKQVVESVEVLTEDGSVRTLTNEQMEFGYRTSILKKKPWIALRAGIVLQKGDQAAITEKMTDLAKRRRDRQPLEYASAGSTFKRPEGYFAGKLIQDSGLMGYHVGDACVSEKHAGFVVNKGHADSTQIRKVIEHVQEEVLRQQGVALEREVIFLGEF